MNITFMMGNGFDVGQKLKTSYKDFYPYFVINAKLDNIIRKEIEKDKEFENWSDLEVALGKFTGNISIEDEQRFINDKIELDELLKKYLLNEQEKYELKENLVKEIWTVALQQLRNGNNEEEKLMVQNVLERYASERYIYQCISFNYTNCLDRIWESFRSIEIGKHSYGSTTYQELFGNVLHIHGTLEDNEMIVGVNDESQILNKELAKSRHVKWAMIKPYLNREIGQNKIQKAKQIIDNSGIICLYGMSIGVTDNIWWEYLGEWLKKQNTHILVIYNYDPEYSAGHPLIQLMYMEDVKNKFLNNTNLSDTERQAVESRIIVYNNKNVFEL